MNEILLISHSSTISGPIDYLESYLIRRGDKVLKLNHPLDSYAGRETSLSENRRILWSKKRKNLGLFSLFWDFFCSLKVVAKKKPEICIGANNFDTFAALAARRYLRQPVKKIVYFASDFSENRFGSKALDSIYLAMERCVIKHADLVVSNTKRAQARRFEFGLAPEKGRVISNGVHLHNPVFEEKNIAKDNFIFVGNVTKEHGLYELINVLRPLIGRLVIIGDGDDLQRVVELCERNQIKLELHYRKPHDFVIDYLKAFSGFGLAPYNRESKWTYYCSPLKVNEYIACGLPVIVSDVPEIAGYVQESKLGIVYKQINYDELKGKILEFDESDFQTKAKKFYDQFNYNVLYSRIEI